MGLRLRKNVGGKHLKFNIGKGGLTSTSLKIAKGVSLNSKRGLTVGIPGTGLSYNFGKKKNKAGVNVNENYTENLEVNSGIIENSSYGKKFREITGGYNKKSIVLIFVSVICLFTPLMPIASFTVIIGLLWFIIDTLIKIVKTNRALK